MKLIIVSYHCKSCSYDFSVTFSRSSGGGIPDSFRAPSKYKCPLCNIENNTVQIGIS